MRLALLILPCLGPYFADISFGQALCSPPEP
jgi:hypothetical protein